MFGATLKDGNVDEVEAANAVESWAYAVEARAGWRELHGLGEPVFTLHVADEQAWTRLLVADTLQVARAFISGECAISGDLLSAVRWWYARAPRRTIRDWLLRVMARVQIESFVQTYTQAGRNIRFHYDRSTRFYQQFLDRQLVYSCAYFPTPKASLDDAQLAKLEHICHKLALRPGERFLDIGSGWGALVMHAAERYGVHAVGCTLSHDQLEYSRQEITRRGLSPRVGILDRDFRKVTGMFDKMASVGMCEHVGRRRLGRYFRVAHRLLHDEGLFINHGIARPQHVRDDADTRFIRRCVFPGGELPHLHEVLRAAERAGFEVLDVENLRPHYALTCAAWVARLRQNERACLSLVDRETYRTWLLYLAGAAIHFEQATTDVYQLVVAKRKKMTTRRMTRAHVYGASAPAIRVGGPDGPQSISFES